MQDSQMHENGFSKWSAKGFISLFMIFVIMFLFVSLFTGRFYFYFIVQWGLFLLVLSIMYAIGSYSPYLSLELTSLIPAFFFEVLSHHQQSLFYLTISYEFSAAFMALAIYFFTKKIFCSSLITTNLLFGALIVYLLAGLVWGKMYFILNVFSPGSFHSPLFSFHDIDFLKSFKLQFNLVYYSFTVLTTLGIGDIIPANGLTRSFTVIEAIFGQLFVAIIIAKLVSTWRQP